MNRRIATFVTVVVVVLSSMHSRIAHAWCNKEHIQLTRIAAERLIADPSTPPEMVAWLKSAVPGLMTMEQEKDYFLHSRVGAYPRGVDGVLIWATVPDLIANSIQDKVEPFDVSERNLHFIDLEFFVADQA